MGAGIRLKVWPNNAGGAAGRAPRGSPVLARPDAVVERQWFGVELSAANFRQLYVPVGFAHGFCVISDHADVEYLCSDYYDPGGESGLLWNDPAVGVEWPTHWPLVSDKDAMNPGLDRSRPDFFP